MLTSTDILTCTFPVSKVFRPGYAMAQVDDFLDRLADGFRYYETTGAQGTRMLSDEVRAMKFLSTRFGPGYDIDAVNAFLDTAEQTLRPRDKTIVAGE